MKQLTKAEEQIMQAVWNLDKPFLRDILDGLPVDPKPHPNTVSTVLKVLIDKGFLSAESSGRMYRYIPQISKFAYSRMTMKNLVTNYFQGSFKNVVSCMIEENDIDILELELFLKEMKESAKQ